MLVRGRGGNSQFSRDHHSPGVALPEPQALPSEVETPSTEIPIRAAKSTTRRGGAMQCFDSLRSLNVATWPRVPDWPPVSKKNVEAFKPPCEEESEESEG